MATKRADTMKKRIMVNIMKKRKATKVFDSREILFLQSFQSFK